MKVLTDDEVLYLLKENSAALRMDSAYDGPEETKLYHDTADAIDIAIDRIKESQKYRWHYPAENPDDLPDIDPVSYKSEFVLVVGPRGGAQIARLYARGVVGHRWYNQNAKMVNVCKWKYIS